MTFPIKNNKYFKKVINNFLTELEIELYKEKSLTLCNEEAYFCKGLYRGYFNDLQLSNKIKERIKEYLPPVIQKDFKINDLFRLSKYNINSFLPLHEDRVNIYNNYKSIYTINIFLNDNTGGTSFWTKESYGIKKIELVESVKGRATIFDINFLHRGEPAQPNIKLLLRTDVMIPI